VVTKELAQKIFGIKKRKNAIGYVTKRWWIIAKILRLIPNGMYKKM
jgi:membrane-associated protease RseP (regulator of RpoE activity)